MRQASRRRVGFAAALAAVLLAAVLAAAACGKYGPPQRPKPVATSPAEKGPAADVEGSEQGEGEAPREEPAPEQSP
jgi:hypothetical protein